MWSTQPGLGRWDRDASQCLTAVDASSNTVESRSNGEQGTNKFFTHSAHSLRSAPQRSAALHFATLTRSIHGLSDTLHSLLWTIEIHENVITL